MSEPTNEDGASEGDGEILGLPPDVDLPDARLRTVAACVVLPLSLLLFAAPSMAARAFALAGVAASVFWLRAAGRARREAASAPPSSLRLDPEGLELVEAGVSARLPWTAVVDVEVDDAAVGIRVVSSDGTSVLVRPGYGRLGLVELHERIVTWWRRSTSPASEPGARAADHG
ncbi:MAG: hypothetical protein U0230_07710 [Polyangiales bacterium]